MTAPQNPADLPRMFEAAFNSGDRARIDALFEADAVLVVEPGNAVTGDDRRQAIAGFLDLGLPMRIVLRHVYACDDVALVLTDHRIEGTSTSGEQISIAGTATDVARRGPDGRWRYIIDNPSGVAS